MRRSLPLGYALALSASFALGIANTYANGAYSDHAIPWIVFGIMILAWSYGDALLRGSSSRLGTSPMTGIVWCALATMSWMAWNDSGLIMYARGPWVIGRFCQLAMFALLVSYLPAIVRGKSESRLVRSVRVALLAACVVAAGVDVLRTSPTPVIDTWTVQMEGAKAFGVGLNPYETVRARDTTPGVNASNVPLVYPPMQLFLGWLGYALFGDVRYTMLAAMVIGGLVIRAILRRRASGIGSLLEDGPTLVYWMTPKLFFILEQSWTDPVPIMLLSLTMLAYLANRPVVTAVLFGVFIVVKQTVFWFLPLSIILGFQLWQYGVAGVVALASVLPYLLWDAAALRWALVGFMDQLPIRPDALTLVTWAEHKYHYGLNPRNAYLFAAVICAVSVWRMRAGKAATMTLAGAFLYLVFFVFNKWAFANYYFLIGQISVLAAACSFHSGVSDEVKA